MNICVANKRVNPECYDLVIYLGLSYFPIEERKDNELVLLRGATHVIGNTIISENEIPTKKNIIFLNKYDTNFLLEDDGRKIYKVAKGGHYEIEL